MTYVKCILLVHMVLISTSFGESLDEKYPSYTYVFNEFDVDHSYLYDDAFISFVEKHEKSLKAFYTRSLRRGEDMLPMMQGLLISDGVSDLFIYLSMVESGFSTVAESPKKAVGLWQFMPATARQYNLTVCNSYDERCDAVSATSAAINYLNKLHQQFNKWYLAAMAYNCGEGCVERAIQSAGTDELSVLTDDNLNYLPKETREYIKKILLLAMIGENVTLGYGLDVKNDFEHQFIQVDVAGGTSLHKLANLLKMQEKELLNLNRAVKDGQVPQYKSKYKITIPAEKLYAFYLRYEEPSVMKTGKTHMVLHNIKLGESLENIAKQYQADVTEIRVANHLTDNFLVADSILVIPVTEDVFNKISS